MAENAFLPVLLGARETAYGLACSFYEAYGVTSVALAQEVAPICEHSKVVRAASVAHFGEAVTFRAALLDFAAQSSPGHQTLILLSTENRYARLLSECADDLREYYRFVAADDSLVQRLALKSAFYALCQQHGLPYPAFTLVSPGQTPADGAGARSAEPAAGDNPGTKTPVAAAGRGSDAPASASDRGCEQARDELLQACELLPLSALGDATAYPLVMKPDDPEAFDELAFRGKKNAYELRNRAEFDYGMSMMNAAGLVQPVVVQRQVAGPDDALHSLTCYCDQAGRVRLVAQADVVLEQEAPWSIGHFGAVVAGADRALAQQVAGFLQAIGYRGFCNIDVKWDASTQNWQFLDFNVALCDTSVLATAAGHNLARVLIDDVFGKEAGNQDASDAVSPSGAAGSAADAMGRVNHSRTMSPGSPSSASRACFATLEPDAAMLTKIPASTLRQYARELRIWPRAQRLMQAHACTELFTPQYDQNFWRWKAYRSDQHFHRREFSDCRGRNHVND